VRETKVAALAASGRLVADHPAPLEIAQQRWI
jgi:hypothetical protein